MKKLCLLAAWLLIAVALASAAPLLVTDSGVSASSDGSQLKERKASWDASQVNEWVVAWIKAGNTTNYQYRVTVTAPDNSSFNEGPFSFPVDGIAKFSKQITYFNGLKTTTAPRPNQGEWKIEFILIDGQNNNKEDLGQLLQFYLTGNDQSQAPTDLNEAKDKAAGDAGDMALMAVMNTARQFGAQQEQQRQESVATSTTVTATTIASTTTTVKISPAKKKAIKKKKK